MGTVPTPFDWVAAAGTVPPAIALQNGVKAPVDFLMTRPFCKVRRTTSLAQATATWTSVAWDFEDADTDGIHAPGSAGLIPTTPGWYLLTGTGSWAVNGAGMRGVRWAINGAVIGGGQAHAPALNSVPNFETVVPARTMRHYLAVGDVLTMELYQSSGGSLGTPTVAALHTEAEIMWCYS